MRRKTASIFLAQLLIVVPLFFLPSSPADAQRETEQARLAPAIGPWLGAPRGNITNVRAIQGGVEIDAVVRDADSTRAVDYELVVDGTVAQSARAPRPVGLGREAEFSDTVFVDDGLHRVCLRLLDARFGGRTVDCVTATTAPPNTVSAAVANGATGVLVSPSGVVLPVVSGSPGNWRVKTPCGNEISFSNGTHIERARVVIDPGHGGSESGANGGAILEKNLNLEVSEILVEKLEALGISTELTRTADYRVPIRTRADIATALAPDVFLSLHHNGGAIRRSTRPGTEVFYATGQPEAQRLAAIMYEEMVDSLDEFNVSWVSTVNEGASVRLRQDGQDLYGIHRFSPQVTSIITEYVYLSNPSESELMQRAELPEIEAEAIVDGLLRWWWTTDAGTSLGNRFVDGSSSGTGGFDNCVDPSLIIPSTQSNSLQAPSRTDVLTDEQTGNGQQRVPLVVTPAGSLLPALLLDNDPAIG